MRVLLISPSLSMRMKKGEGKIPGSFPLSFLMTENINSILFSFVFPFKKKKTLFRVPVMAQQLVNPTSIHEDSSSIPGLAQWAKDPALL